MNNRRNNNKFRKKRPQKGRTVIVQDNNVQRALKQFRRLITQEGVLLAYYKHRYYVKPSQIKKRKKSIGKFKQRCRIQNALKADHDQQQYLN